MDSFDNMFVRLWSLKSPPPPPPPPLKKKEKKKTRTHSLYHTTSPTLDDVVNWPSFGRGIGGNKLWHQMLIVSSTEINVIIEHLLKLELYVLGANELNNMSLVAIDHFIYHFN